MPKTFLALVDDFKTLSNDASSGTTAKTLLNIGVRKILGLSDWSFMKGSKTYSTGTNVYEYGPPYDMNKVDYVHYSYGSPGIWYVPKEVQDEEDWRKITSVRTVSASIPDYWFISDRTKKISLYPMASDSQGTVEVGYTKKIKDYSVADYSTGTCGVSANGTVWTGSGVWTTSMIGRYIQTTNSNTDLDGFWFEIDSIKSGGTTLYTKELAPSSTGTASYKISELIPLPDGFEDIPLWFALGKYYNLRQDIALSREYYAMYNTDVDNLFKRDSRSVKSLMEKQNFDTISNPSYDPWRMGTLS